MPHTQRSPLLIPESPPFEVSRISNKGRRRRLEKRGGSPSPLARRLSWTPPPPSPPGNASDSFAEADAVDTDEMGTHSMLPPPALNKQRRRRQGTPRSRDRTRRFFFDSPASLEVSPPTDAPLSPTRSIASTLTDASKQADCTDLDLQTLRDALHTKEIEASNSNNFKESILTQLRQLEEQNVQLVNACESERGSRVASRSLSILQIDEAAERIDIATMESTARSAIMQAIIEGAVLNCSRLQEVESTIDDLKQKNCSLEAETEALTEMVEETRMQSEAMRSANSELQKEREELEERLHYTTDNSWTCEDSVRKERDMLRVKVDELISQMSMMQGDGWEEECTELREELGKYREQVEKLTGELEHQTSLGATVQDQLVKESTTRWGLETELRKARASSEPREGSDSSLQTFLQASEEQVEVLKDELQKTQTSLASVKAERDAYLTKLSTKGEAGRLGAPDIKLAVLKADLSLAREEARQRSLELNQAKEACELFKRELSQRDLRIETLQETLKKVQHSVDSEQIAMLKATVTAAEQRVKSAINDAKVKAAECEAERHASSILREKVIALETELDGSRQAGATASSKADTLNKRILSLISKHESEMALVSEVGIVNDELKAELAKATEAHQAVGSKLRQEQYQTKILNTTVESLEGRLKRGKEEKRKLEFKLDDATAQNGDMLEEMTRELQTGIEKQTKLEKELHEKEKELLERQSVLEENAMMKVEMETCMARMDEIEQSLAALQKENRSLRKENNILQEERSEQQGENRALQEENSELHGENKALKSKRNMRTVDTSTCSEGMLMEGLLSEVSPESEVSEMGEEMMMETKRVLKHAEKAIAMERKKNKLLLTRLHDQEAHGAQQAKEVKTLRYRLQVLSTALTSDISDSPPSPSRYTLPSDISSCTEADDISVSSMPSSASALRRELRVQSQRIGKARSPPARTRDSTSFQFVMNRMADLTKKHGSQSSATSSYRSPRREDTPKRASSAKVGSWRQNHKSRR